MFMDEAMLQQMMGGGMMGGMMGGGRRGGGNRRRVQEIPLPVTLAQCYSGYNVTIPHSRKILCSKCKGKGCKPGSSGTQQCRACRGQGATIQLVQIAPGMAQQVQAPCEVCFGEGSVIKDKDKCPGCNGARLVEQDAALEVYVEKGMASGHEIPFNSQGDMHPDAPGQSGSVVVVLQCEKHSVFTRDGDDLIMTKKLTVAEALCGVKFVVPHLDGRKLLINTCEDVIKPGDSKAVLGEGMPVFQGGANKKGNLIINFTVTFPEMLGESAVTVLRSLLPPPGDTVDFDRAEAEECFVDRQPMDRLKEEAKKSEEIEEGEGVGGGQSVQCGQQ